MKKIKFLTFGLFALLAAVTLNSYGQDNNFGKETTDPFTYDKGVVINGVKWATRNVDKPGTFTAKPEDAGMFYQWNRKVGWSATDPMINSNGDTDWDKNIPAGTIWEKSNDPCPAGYRVPTYKEIRSLLDAKVTNEWITQNGVNGKKITDTATGESVFLPAAGYRAGGSLHNYGDSRSGYWSRTKDGSDSACSLNFFSFILELDYSYRALGFSCRCVAE